MVTLTGPVVADKGTVAKICVSLQLRMPVNPPAKLMELQAIGQWLDWKPVPAIVTVLPTPPMFGVRLVICGAGTLKSTLLVLVTPPSTTLTVPVIAGGGTIATTCLSDQLTMLAGWPLAPFNFTVLDPSPAP